MNAALPAELLDAEQTFLGWGLGKLVQMKETYLTEEDLGGMPHANSHHPVL